mmetsp:Transcript_91994/g.269105  ORF Transcript_91994/g.269105 Transcript_91994/m.269105 type:complete len:235 (+) Transcript_91994:884-1588(+)
MPAEAPLLRPPPPAAPAPPPSAGRPEVVVCNCSINVSTADDLRMWTSRRRSISSLSRILCLEPSSVMASRRFSLACMACWPLLRGSSSSCNILRTSPSTSPLQLSTRLSLACMPCCPCFSGSRALPIAFSTACMSTPSHASSVETMAEIFSAVLRRWELSASICCCRSWALRRSSSEHSPRIRSSSWPLASISFSLFRSFSPRPATFACCSDSCSCLSLDLSSSEKSSRYLSRS